MNEYFVSILQLREDRKDVEEFIEKELKAASSKGISLSRVKKVRNGYDYYLNSNKFAVALGRKLESEFGGELKVSRRIFGKDRQTSKDLYRINVLFKPSLLRLGDVVFHDGKVIKVTGLGKKASGTVIENGKKILIKDTAERLETHVTTVSKIYPHVEVINTENYQSVRLYGSSNLKVGEKVKVVFHSGSGYFVKRA